MPYVLDLSPEGVIKPTPLDPEEPIVATEAEGLTDARVLDFWRWAYSDLVGNTNRGVFAEFLVAMAVGALGDTSNSWAAFDLETEDGKRLEVKSASFAQAWHQKEPSRIVFSIRRTLAWRPETNTFVGTAARHSDAYVFCLLAEKNKKDLNPLDLNQWEFYVISTAKIDRDFGDQKSISLRRVQALSDRYQISGLKNAVDAVKRSPHSVGR